MRGKKSTPKAETLAQASMDVDERLLNLDHEPVLAGYDGILADNNIGLVGIDELDGLPGDGISRFFLHTLVAVPFFPKFLSILRTLVRQPVESEFLDFDPLFVEQLFVLVRKRDNPNNGSHAAPIMVIGSQKEARYKRIDDNGRNNNLLQINPLIKFLFAHHGGIRSNAIGNDSPGSFEHVRQRIGSIPVG